MRGRHKHPLAVLVWAGISKRGATEILVFKGIMEADFYIRDVLTKTFVNFANAAYGSTKNCILMQDNGTFKYLFYFFFGRLILLEKASITPYLIKIQSIRPLLRNRLWWKLGFNGSKRQRKAPILIQSKCCGLN